MSEPEPKFISDPKALIPPPDQWTTEEISLARSNRIINTLSSSINDDNPLLKDLVKIIIEYDQLPIFIVGSNIDVLDTANHWVKATIKEIQNGKALISYEGWSSKWNEWIELDVNSTRMTVLHTFTSKDKATGSGSVVFRNTFTETQKQNKIDSLVTMGFDANTVRQLYEAFGWDSSMENILNHLLQ